MRRYAIIAAACGALWATACGDEENGLPACDEGASACSEEGYVLSLCQGGSWQTIRCLADHGQLCEEGACVDPWRHGSPQWDTCPHDPLAVPETLASKMIYYEDISRRLHVRPPRRWMLGLSLACREVACGAEETPPCHDCSLPVVAEEEAGIDHVQEWHPSSNEGLWSSLYLTSQAYRYAVTGDAEALSMLHLLLLGKQDRMAITGVRGLFTRRLIPPDVPGVACPTDPEHYVPAPDKDANMYVRIGPDGCVQTADPITLEFVSSSHCGLEAYAGWCWLDNVSQDEYSGHMLSLAAVMALVDDAAVRGMAAELLGQVAEHLMENDLELVDWDGRRAQYGALWPMFVLGGYGAAQSLAYLAAAAFGTQDPIIREYYDECLLQKSGQGSCWPDDVTRAQVPFDEILEDTYLYVGLGACRSNWNNFAMTMLFLHTLLLVEQDPPVREAAQVALEKVYLAPDKARPLVAQHNVFYNFQYAALKRLGPASDGPAHAAVADGICQLRQFPTRLHTPSIECPETTCVPDEGCIDRFDETLSVHPRQTAERCPHNFLWWRNPYRMEGCTEDLRRLYPPTSYLLPYWMGRYYGFIHEDM